MRDKAEGATGSGGVVRAGARQVGAARNASTMRGIIIANGCSPQGGEESPTVVAFIWGGKVRPVPSLPYGRVRGAA